MAPSSVQEPRFWLWSVFRELLRGR
jgi:hypothetical protein